MVAAVEYPAMPGGPEGLEEVYVAHHARMFRAAYRVTGNSADAEDVLQTVFLRLAKAGAGTIANVESYLHRAAVNAALDLLRARRATRSVPIDEAAGVSARSSARETPQLREKLRQAVAQLHPTAAEMFALRYFEDTENAEIAQLLGTTPGVVAVTLHRARTRLQELLRSEMGELS